MIRDGVQVSLTVSEWERVLHALASHDRGLWEQVAEALRTHSDEEKRASMVWPWR